LKRLLALSLLLFLSCAPDTVTAPEWRAMSREDRVLYVRSLIGEETAKDAKGNRGRTYDQPAETYVDAIDAAYARGDGRAAEEIFAELSEAR
jgi:hypothetical protein